jgi:predicted deacetylase
VRRLLVSLHDVTPFHAARLEKAERLLENLGVPSVAYLLVPRFHGRHDITADESFRAWCSRARPFEVEWILHGWEHQEPPAARRTDTGSIGERVRRRWMTAGEGEFLALSAKEAGSRLSQSAAAFSSCIDRRPEGFVPPAWLANATLQRVLTDAGFRFTEDQGAIIDLALGSRLDCPVVTWATRTPTRRLGSRIVAPLLFRLWRDRPVLRIAIHPHDFDYPATVRSIARVLKAALAARTAVSYAEVLGETGTPG